ncbi:unnamed protein product [Ceratitis capitata]|uniref:(Mediterranean fruit fly) hypothetical protein n=1 Tax=Ceratitis capitata TaxID=7213 RepID=A0A811UTB5_CERCA|nr:unnamed protein product [Ceratitis capitata]
MDMAVGVWTVGVFPLNNNSAKLLGKMTLKLKWMEKVFEKNLTLKDCTICSDLRTNLLSVSR